MRINYTFTTLGMSGGYRVIFEIVNRLIERGHSLTITTACGRQHYPTNARIYKPHYVLFKLNERLLRHVLKAEPYYIFNNFELIRKCIPECDINVATDFLSTFPVYLSQKGVLFYHMQHYEKLFVKDAYNKALVEASYRLPFYKIANSNWLKDQMKRTYNIDIPVINPGIDRTVFYPKRVRKGTKKRVVCYCGHDEWKGFADAVAAMRIVFERQSNVEWYVYGGIDPHLSSDKVPYTFVRSPSDEELAELYSSANVVICPSWYESFPLPQIEAMACGTPVVTTSIGVEDYAIHRENALIVPPLQPEIMAEAILEILDDEQLSKKLVKNGLRKVKEFTWENTIDKVEALFLKVLGKADLE